MKKLAAFFVILALLPISLAPNRVEAARLHTFGYENQTAGAPATITAGEEFTSTGCGGGHCDIVTSPVHSGSLAYGSTTATSAFSWMGNVFRADGSEGKAFARCYIYIAVNNDSFDIDLCAFWDSVAVAKRAAVVLDPTGVAQLMVGATQVGSDSAALSTGQWYRIELMAEANGGLSADEIEGRIDGVSFASSAIQNISDFNAVYIGSPGAADNYEVYWDDMSVNDEVATKGSTQTSWQGAGNIVYLRPTASGDNAADAGLFSDVDDVDADDTTTDNDLDNAGSMAYYNITDTSGLIDSYDTITLVDMGIRLHEESSAATVFQFGVKSQSLGLVASSTAQDAGDTTWRTNQTGTTAMTNRMATTTNPQNNSAWTTTTLDSAQIGVGSTDADNIDITSMWLAVEFTDGSPPAAGSTKRDPIIWFD